MPLTRRLILQKARRHPNQKGAPTDCKHTVSGTISLPSRGTFHLSLTVLVRYRSPGSIQAYRVVPADSQQISRARCYSGIQEGRHTVFMYGTLTLYGRPSQATSTNHMFSTTTRRHDSTGNLHPTTPHTQPLPGITCAWFSLIHFRSPLLAESQLFSLPAGTEMFHFPTFPPYALYIQAQVTVHNHCWIPPFGNPRITARLPAPRGKSQPPPSSIGSWSQGTYRVPSPPSTNQGQRD